MLIIPFISFGQITINTTDNTKEDPITNLKNGALLIRLQTNEHLINYYLDNNNMKQAKYEREKQKTENNHIIKTFQKEWSFCPVYFFYSYNSTQITENNFKNVFKNTDETKLNNDEQKILNNNFLIAYLGKNTGSLKFHCLVLNNQKLEQLKHPYPRYVMTYRALWFLRRKLSKTIHILEKKVRWYLRVQ